VNRGKRLEVKKRGSAAVGYCETAAQQNRSQNPQNSNPKVNGTKAPAFPRDQLRVLDITCSTPGTLLTISLIISTFFAGFILHQMETAPSTVVILNR